MSKLKIRTIPDFDVAIDEEASTVRKRVVVEHEFIVLDLEVRKKLIMYKKVLEITPDFTFISLLF